MRQTTPATDRPDQHVPHVLAKAASAVCRAMMWFLYWLGSCTCYLSRKDSILCHKIVTDPGYVSNDQILTGANTMKRYFVAALAALSCSSAIAGPVTVLTFEGVGDYVFIEDYYASAGVVFAPDAFGPNALAVVNIAGGGLSDFYNQPSGTTIMSIAAADTGTVNVADGFDTGFSFFYSSASGAVISVYDGVDGSGLLLGSLTLVAQFDTGCIAAQAGTFCNWTASGLTFSGIARSVVFADPSQSGTGYDNLTFGSGIPFGVPEPSAAVLLVGGAGLVAAARRRRQA
jgi:hypothetical protein